MIYRLLQDAEKQAVAAAFPEHYAGLDFGKVKIAGAVDEEGKVRAFAVLNMVPHCEPMWIEPGAPVDFRRLVRVVEQEAGSPELWVFAPDAKIARMAEICGAKPLDWKVFRKEVS